VGGEGGIPYNLCKNIKGLLQYLILLSEKSSMIRSIGAKCFILLFYHGSMIVYLKVV
jgi:hypothetical protein